MEEDLQGLLDRIKKDGIDKAEAQAGEILAAAEERARAIVEEAERTAADLLAKAETDSQVFTERSTKTLEHVARDFLIGVQRGLEAVFRASVAGAVGEALTPETALPESETRCPIILYPARCYATRRARGRSCETWHHV